LKAGRNEARRAIIRSMAAQSHGVSPWGRWFVEALEGYDESGRLARGKSYANTGKVPELDFAGCSRNLSR